MAVATPLYGGYIGKKDGVSFGKLRIRFGRPIPNGYLIAKREPYGVCGQIIPWNRPAVAASNTVVLKPDVNASLSTLELRPHFGDASSFDRR